jgi:ribA/ribD-fused uncharacterized protein
MTIYFYQPQDKYGCFSNFSPHGFELDGYWWATNEHFFQAQKFLNQPRYHLIRQASTPKEAASLGRDKTYPLRPEWEFIKDEVMQRGVLRKFEIHQDIREILFQTGEELIVEDSPVDYYWGCGADKTGKNRLGYILMQVREILRLAPR